VNNWNPQTWTYDEDYRNLVFCIRWRQVRNPDPPPDPAPAWIRYVWDERAWGRAEDYSYEPETPHVYVTSSWGKPENGMSLDGSPNLPAYQVQVHSFWVLDWKETWEHRVRWTDCKWTGDPDDSCEGQKKYATQQHERWDPGNDDGTTDLRRYGAAHFYVDSTKVRTPDGRVMNVLPVPVIEVQGVIGNPNQ